MFPGYDPFQELLRRLYTDAHAQADKAAASARASRRTGTQAFRDAAAEQQHAEQLGVTPQAVQGLYRAAQAYDAALAAPPDGPNADVVRSEVEQVLGAVARAYETKDMDAINRLLEFMRYESLKQIERNPKEYRSVMWHVAVNRIDILSDGAVRASCTLTRKIDKKSGQDISDVRPTTFTLRKVAGDWKILSQSYP